MNQKIKRPEFATRMEMTPLLDVIFLLLTFFIYAFIFMIPTPNILNVQLPTITEGTPAEPDEIFGVTVDTAGTVFINQEQSSIDQITSELSKLKEQGKAPHVYIAIEDQSNSQAEQKDRLLLYLEITQKIRAAGVDKINLVGQPGESLNSTENTETQAPNDNPPDNTP